MKRFNFLASISAVILAPFGIKWFHKTNIVLPQVGAGDLINTSDTPAIKSILRHYPGVPFGHNHQPIFVYQQSDINDGMSGELLRQYDVFHDGTHRVWHNADKTWSKNIVTEGYITDAELQKHCMKKSI